jgi:hypothetical protein
MLHNGSWSAGGVAGEVGLPVVVVVGSRFKKERGNGGELVDVKAGQHHGRRCRAMVSSW